LGLKKWAQIPRTYFIGGFALWLGIIFWTTLHQSFTEISFIIVDQINSLGIISLIASAVFISAAIPRLLFQIGHGVQLNQSKRNWLMFFGFSLVNLVLAYGKEIFGWDIDFAIPGLLFSQIAWVTYTFQEGQMNALLRWGISLFSLSTLIHFFLTGNDPGINAFIHWSLICQSVILLLFPLFIGKYC
jgi:hypothetical protein